MFTKLITLALLATAALAEVYVTGPIASTTGVGGQTMTVTWADSGSAPLLAAIGQASVDLYTGSVNQQSKLQNLAASVDVSKAASVQATIDPSVGESGQYYFVRFTSLGLKDVKNPQYNYQAYSAIFTLNGMTGTFNSTVKAQIAGAAGAAASSGPLSVAASASASVSGGAKASGSASASVKAAKASTTVAQAAASPSSGAGRILPASAFVLAILTAVVSL